MRYRGVPHNTLKKGFTKELEFSELQAPLQRNSESTLQHNAKGKPKLYLQGFICIYYIIISNCVETEGLNYQCSNIDVDVGKQPALKRYELLRS